MMHLLREGFLYVALCMLASAATTAATAGTVDVPFVFSDDQSVPQADLSQGIKPSNALRNDSYLNAPVTRLEYFLIRIETRLNQESAVAVIRDELEKRFDRIHPRVERKVQGYARYSEDNGRIVLGYEIDDLGRPRAPMRDACHDVLKHLELTLPQEHVGYILHNTVLGVLAQKDYITYSSMLATVASHFVHRTKLVSTSHEQRTQHIFTCQRTAKDGSITYDRTSLRLEPSPRK
jgi:hypothetical protein